MSSNTLSSENNGHDPAPTVQPLPGEVAAAKSKRAPGAASAGQRPRDPGGPFTGRSPAELTDTIGQLHALSCAAIGVMLEAVAAYDTTQAWREDGAGSLGQWLCYELGVTNATGAQYARVATALVDLPVMSCELAAGQLGFEQVRALTRVATADTEASLVSEARGMTASEVEAMVRRLRSVSTEEASRANASRSLRLRWGIEDRMLRLGPVPRGGRCGDRLRHRGPCRAVRLPRRPRAGAVRRPLCRRPARAVLVRWHCRRVRWLARRRRAQ